MLADHGGLHGQLALIAQPGDARLVESVEGHLELLTLLNEVLQALQKQLSRLLLLRLESLNFVPAESSLVQLLSIHDRLLLQLVGELDQVAELCP